MNEQSTKRTDLRPLTWFLAAVCGFALLSDRGEGGAAAPASLGSPDVVQAGPDKVNLQTIRARQIMGVPMPSEMHAIDENDPFVVPDNSYYVVTGVVPRGNWPGQLPVEVRFDGKKVLYTHMAREDFKEVPAGLVAGPGTLVEVDNLGASDSRVSLLGYVSH